MGLSPWSTSPVFITLTENGHTRVKIGADCDSSLNSNYSAQNNGPIHVLLQDMVVRKDPLGCEHHIDIGHESPLKFMSEQGFSWGRLTDE